MKQAPRITGSAATLADSENDRSAQQKKVLVIVLMVAISLAWIALAQTALFVGPSEWDDNLYCDIAAMPREMPSVAARYFHTWTLRLFNLVMDTRQDAGGLYPTLLTVGLSWVGFLLGRRMAGAACGLVAAVLMPLYPSLLKYITVPYCDTSMAFWSGVAIVCALIAVDAAAARRRIIATACAGMCCVLSTMCKEPGIAVVVPVALTLWACDQRWKLAIWWIGGCAAGWLLLSALDWVFLNSFWWHWHWSTFFPKKTGGGGGGSATNRMSQHYVQMLLMTEFLGFTLLGVAGMAAGFRTNRAVRAAAVWAFAVLVFSSLISCKYHGVQALDRYCTAMGVPLVILGAFWIVHVWRRTAEDAERDSLGRTVGLSVALLLMLGVASYGLISELSGENNRSIVRYAFFAMPPAMLLLFLAPWITSGRWLPRVALVLLVAAAAGVGLKSTLTYARHKRAQLKPWVTLTAAMDQTGATLATWHIPKKPYAVFRIARRCRTLSTKPPQDIAVRKIESLDDLRENEWLFSTRKAESQLRERGWVPFVGGAQQNGEFIVYRPKP